MSEDYTIKNQLSRIVYEKVKRDPYPEPKPYIDSEVVRKQLIDLKAEKTPRPKTKGEYIDLLNSLDAQLKGINAKNAQIAIDNETIRKAVDDKYTDDIASAKLDPINIGEALLICIDYQLSQTQWWTTPDCGLSSQQQLIADSWRLDMMKVIYDNADISKSLEQYNKVLTAKPKYSLKFGASDRNQIAKLETAIELRKNIYIKKEGI